MANATRIAGLILAGGRGERLGGTVKSELVVGGRRLLERVAERLADCAPLLVAHGHLSPSDLRLAPEMRPVADIGTNYAGPLAGLSAAIAKLTNEAEPQAELVVCAAVDAPFLPERYVAELVAALGDAPCAVAGYAGQPYPTNSIWRVEPFRDLPARVAAGTAPRSLKTLAATSGGRIVPWPESAAGDPFANINTPDQLAAARARADGFRHDPA